MNSAWIKAIATLVLGVFPLSLWAQSDTRIAIIDTAYDTRPYLDRLVENGVTVIGRYYARCDQPEYGLRQKRIINQGLPSDPSSEIAQMFSRGIAMLSIYQYYNNSAEKFRGRTRDGKILPDGNCSWSNIPRTVEDEARLDVDAAIAQARSVGQPPGTAIYFGVDFNFTNGDRETIDLMVRYFRVVRRSMVAAGYKLGAYGSGFALETLQNTDGGLIDYAWISASRAFNGTSAFHRTGNWHLFQNQVDREWFGMNSSGTCVPGLPLDTNVQNMFQASDVGFWINGQAHVVDELRTFDIFATRRFACNGDAVVRKSKTSPSSDVMRKATCKRNRSEAMASKIDFANAARVGDNHGDLIQVDIDDDGAFDGWTWYGNLTGHFGYKPDWIFETARRNAQKCD